MVSVASQRPPSPFDLKLGNDGLMLVPGADGLLIGKKTQSLENVAPTAQEYGSAPIYKERTFAFKPTRGMGERMQSSHTSRRYRYMLNCQVVGGLFGKGPLTHSITPSSTGSVRDFVEGLHGGTLTQFILAGQYVLRRSGDTNGTQTVSKDLGGGRIATSTVRFKGAYVTPIDGVYVATDNGQLWQYDGAAWNAATLPAGFLPSFLERVGNELWAGGGNEVRKCTGDPLLAASWSGAFNVGDASSNLTAIRQVDNAPVFFKDDGGIYTLASDGSDNDLLPGLRVTRDTSNARTAQAGLDALWFRMGPSFYRLRVGTLDLTPIGPERLRDNDSEVNGPVQAFSFWGTTVGFATTYNGTNSYLWSYGDWQVPTDPSTNADAQFVDQWDGALVKWTSKQATVMRISGIASPDTRLYVGFSDGSWDYIKLVPNPFAAGSGAEFTLSSSKMYIPLHHAMFQPEWKATMGFSGFGPVLNALDYAQIAYRMDGSTVAYTSLAGSITATGQRLDTPDPTVGHLLDTEITLVNSTSADTPILEGVAIHERVAPNLRRDFSGTINARSFAAKRDGTTDRKTGDQIRELVYQAAGAPGSVQITMPDEAVQGLAFFQYQERMSLRNQSYGRGWAIDFAATEFTTTTVHGTIGRFRGVLIGDLHGVAIGALKTW